MDLLPNTNCIHVQTKANAIIIVIYLMNVLYTCVKVEVGKDFSPVINELWNSCTELSPK